MRIDEFWILKEDLGGSISYGDFYNNRWSYKDTSEDDFEKVYLPSLLSGGDYSGNTLERSNYLAFLEQFGEVKGVYDYYSGDGVYGIALTQSAYDNEEIQECLKALEDYPVIDDEKLSNLEWDLYAESWKDYGADDFIRELKTKFSLGDRPYTLDLLESLIEDERLQLFFESLIASGEYFISGSGYTSVNIRVEAAVENCSESDLSKFIKECRNEQRSAKINLVSSESLENSTQQESETMRDKFFATQVLTAREWLNVENRLADFLTTAQLQTAMKHMLPSNSTDLACVDFRGNVGAMLECVIKNTSDHQLILEGDFSLDAGGKLQDFNVFQPLIVLGTTGDMNSDTQWKLYKYMPKDTFDDERRIWSQYLSNR